jgi:hypothetical protein
MELRTGGQAIDGLDNRAEDEGMAKRKGKRRGHTHQRPEDTESYSNNTRVEETPVFPPSNGAPIGSCSDTNGDTGDVHQPHNPPTSYRLPSPPINPSSEKTTFKARQQDPCHWDSAATPSQGTAFVKPGTRDMNSNEVLNTDTEDNEQEKEEDKQPQSQPKRSSGMSYSSFSSAVTGGGGGPIVIGQCHTVSVTAGIVSKIPRSGSTETDGVSGASPSASMGADGEMEFTFPTLNSQATHLRVVCICPSMELWLYLLNFLNLRSCTVHSG